LKSWHLDKRVGSLSEKLKPASSDGIRIDFDSFTEPEKQLFRKIWEIEQKYGSSPPADVIEANKEFIFKAGEVVSWRVLELFMFVVRMALLGDEIEEWYFKLHLYNFLADLSECLKRVRKWSEKDREEFLRDMKENDMMNRVFRIPGGFNEHNTAKGKEKEGSD
jgi:hypothetical protein